MSDYRSQEPLRLDATKAVGVVILAAVVLGGIWLETPRLVQGPPKEQKTALQLGEGDLTQGVAEELKNEYQRQTDASAKAQEFVRKRWKLGTPPMFPPEQQRVDSLGEGHYRVEGNAVYFDGGDERLLPYTCDVAATPQGVVRPLVLRMGGEEFAADEKQPGTTAQPGTGTE